MAINPNNGVLDIINGTLKVSSIDIKQAGGFSTAINTVARNDVLLFDDQKSTTTFTPTAQGGYMSSTGVTRDTSSNYLELGTASDGGWVYWPLQLPNSWHTEFDMHVTATGGVLTFSLFNTSEPNHTNYANNDGGYKIVFDNTNNQIVIYWEGSVHKTVSATLRSNDWQSVNINYFQGAISVSLAGKVVLTHEFTENYQEFDSRYIGFSATAGTSHKIRHLRVHNSDKWLYTKTSNASDISYVSGNVGIGSLSPTELLDVHGNVHIAKNLTVDGNLTVTGTTTFIDSTNLAVEDPIIELARGNTSDTIDAGLIVSRSTSNVAVAYRGDEEELALGYTQSGASDTDVTPVANGGLDVRVYGNLFANNLTTTANVEATYLKGNVVTSNLTVSGNYTMGGDIIPDTNDAYDIGSAEKKIRDMYVSDNSLWVGDETKISFTGGKMRFRKRKKNVVPAAILTAGGTSAGAKSFAGKTDLNNIKIHEWLKYMRTLSGKSNAKMGDVFRDNNDDYEATTAAEAWKDMNDDVYTTSNVSVGKTTSPTVRLDVEGDGKFSGNVVTIGNIGISKTTPDANLHVMGYQYVNGPPTLTNAFDHSDAPLTLTHGTATSSTAINDPKPLLHLTRSGTNNESYGARASFNLSRYENSSTHSRSRLDVALADGTYAESTVMTLRADGKVGVGVTSPAYKLDVDGDLNLSTGSTLRINGTPAVFSNWTVSGSDIYRSSGNVGVGVTSPAYKLDVDGDLNLSTGSTLRINGTPAVFSNWTVSGSDIYRSSGNVGIGATSPLEKLDVRGTIIAPVVSYDANQDAPYLIASSSNYTGATTNWGTYGIQHRIKTDSGGVPRITVDMPSGGEVFSVVNGGNIGIGNTSPAYKLDVNGDINVSSGSAIRLNGTALENSATIEAVKDAGTANKIAQRNASGDIHTRLFRSTYQNQTTISGGIAYRVSTTDNYIRFCTDMGAVRSHIGAYGSGSNITRTSHSNGYMVGSYNNVGSNSYKTNPIYTIGSSYMPSDAALNNMYGIGYSHGNFTSILTGGWGMYVAADGDARIGLNGSSGHIKCTGYVDAGTEIYCQNWFRTRGNAGHYWETSSNGNGWHIYPKDRADMYLRTGAGNGGICGTVGNTTARGYIHWTTGNEIGFLTNGRAWSLRMDSNKKCHIYGHLETDGRHYADNGVHVRGDWFRINGNNGLYFESHGGGWYMTDSTWVRVYNGKSLWCNNGIMATNYRCGVGTSGPHVPLHVYGTGASLHNGSFRYMSVGGGPHSGYGAWGAICASFEGGHVRSTDSFLAHNGSLNTSDERIKKEISDINDASALETLRLIQPKTYKYKDEEKMGSDVVYGFIAQQIQEVLPYATKTLTEYLPSICEMSNVTQSNVITFTNFNTNDLLSNTTIIQAQLFKGENKDLTISKIIDEHSIRVEEDLTEMLHEDETRLYIYGEQVDDFLFLKKESIFTVATAALQEVDRQLQAEKAKVATLETQLASVLARLDTLENPPS